jgi:hypothetical protein
MSANESTATAAKKLRRNHLWFVLIPLVILISWLLLPSTKEPVWQGKTLRQWMRGHPGEYVPALQAMGTNAIPFLFSQLQYQDSAPAKMVEEALRRCLDSIPPWETARMRRYHARLALQILDTNAVPALLQVLFQEPFQLKEGHITWEAANAFGWLNSPAAREQVRRELSIALDDPDVQKRRSACMAFYAGFRGNDSETHKLVERTRDSEPLVRAAATRGLIMWQSNEVEVIPALVARLDDPQAAIRRLAIEGLTSRTTNAIAALPALQAAYKKELTRTSLKDDVDDIFRGNAVLSPQENQWGIRYAIQHIAPGTPLPGVKQ